MSCRFTKLFFISARYPKLLWGIVLLISCASAWCVARTEFATDMCYLLPRDSLSYRNLETVIGSGTANRITFYFSRKDGVALENSADMKAMEKFAENLKSIKGVTQVITSAAVASQEKLYRDSLAFFPLYHTPAQLPQGEKLAECFQKNMRVLYLNPFGGAVQGRYDPFGWTTGQLGRLENILKISGLHFYPGNTSFIFSPDRKVCMILVYTDVSPADYPGSFRLVRELNELSGKLPEHLKSEFFCSHLHMLENARIMQTDLGIFAVCTLLLFAALFAFVYRCDWRGIMIPFLAGLGSFWGAAALGICFEIPLLFTLAMGGVLMGIAGDYGIHLYAVSFSGRRVQEGIALCRKLILAFVTTAAAFLGFMFSGVPAFVQFGAYSVLTLLFAVILLFALLPGVLFFKKVPRKAVDFFTLFHLQSISSRHVWICLILLVLLGWGIFRVKFDSDIRKFDIAFEKSAQKESVYQQAFTRTGYPHLLFYSAGTFDSLLEKCRNDKAALQKAIPRISMVTPSDFFPGEAEMKQNISSWKAYVASGEWEKYKKEFLQQAEKSGFTGDFYREFFAGMEKSIQDPPQKQPEILSFVHKSMIGKGARWTGIAMVDKRYVNHDELLKNSSAVVFSEEIFTRQLFTDILGKLPHVIPWVLFAVFSSVVLMLRSFVKACLAFLPVAACLAGIAGVHGLLQQEITLAVVVAGIITVGIAVDYGILLVNSDMEKHIFNSIAFSAVTTAVGGLTVLFTRHPMLRAAGLTIVAGSLAGCFFSFCLLYPILKTLRKNRSSQVTLWLVGVFLLGGTVGCSSLPREDVLPLSPVPDGVKLQLPQTELREFQGKLTLDYRTGQNVFLIAGKTTPDGPGYFDGFSPGGIQIFSLAGKKFDLHKFKWMKDTVPEKQQRKISEFLYRAVSAGIYVPEAVRSELKESSQKGKLFEVLCADGGKLTFRCSGPLGTVARKRYGKDDLRWLVEYCRKDSDNDCVYIYSEEGFLQARVGMKFYN